MLIVASVLLAYLFTAIDMVFMHIDAPALDRPTYAGGPFYQKVLAGAMWPLVSWRNEEFRWFICTYLGCLLTITAYLALTVSHVSYFWAIAILCICKPLPLVGPLVGGLFAIAHSIFWFFLALIFRWKVPGAVERFSREQDYRKSMRKFHKQLRG